MKATTTATRSKIARLLVAKAKEEYSVASCSNSIAPYSPSPMTMVEKMIVRLQLTTEDVVYDLGCGDGRWLIAAAQQAACQAIGVEIDPQLVAKVQQAIEQENLQERVSVICQDIWTISIQNATIVIVYAFMDSLRQLKESLLSQLQPKTRILSVGVRNYTIFCLSTSSP